MALYLKYRPKDFKSLVGQDFIKQTLQKAVEEEKTVGAYLLCGPRGTGKTSTARILAKAVNCLKPENGNPCNNCEICNEINKESLVDVIEIDAASNTGVDNIREIISKANFRPTRAKFKIYIIDEVHMLSKGAFNALLKILEEPPEFVKFILATTETHKVPDTIISRCQRYDFKNFNAKDLESRLNFIAKEEKIEIDKDSLDYIIKSSNGGARNAISLFEQLTKDKKILYKNIEQYLGISSKQELQNFSEKLLQKDASVIDDLEEISKSGKNIKLFFKDLILLIKNRTIEKVKKDGKIKNEIEILDLIDEYSNKAKNSIDENTTFLICILKIIKGGKNNIHIEKNTIYSNENIKNNITKEGESLKKVRVEENENIIEIEEKKIKTEENKEKIKIEDIGDIFGGETQKNEKVKSLNINFDKDNFLDKLKNNGVKGMIISSLKQSNISIEEGAIKINFQTKFVYKQFNNEENLGILRSTLEMLGLPELDIKLS